MRNLTAAHRGALTFGLVICLLAGACGDSDSDDASDDTLAEPETTTISYGGVQEMGGSGYAAAVLHGDFEAEGIEFAPTWATSGAVILQGLVGGDFQVANLGPSQLYAAIQNGACARVLRPTSGAAYGLIAQPDLHLNSDLPYPEVLTQLEGKTIGVAARGAAQELVVATMLEDAGLDPATDVTWVAIGAGAPATTAFSSRQVDAALSYSQLETNLEASGTAFDKVLDLSGSDTPLGTFIQAMAVANCDWADDNPDTVERFCHALNQGFDALAEDPEVGPRAFAYVKLGTNEDESAELWEKYKDPLIEIPPLTEENWEYQARFNPDHFVPDFSEYVVDGCATA